MLRTLSNANMKAPQYPHSGSPQTELTLNADPSMLGWRVPLTHNGAPTRCVSWRNEHSVRNGGRSARLTLFHFSTFTSLTTTAAFPDAETADPINRRKPGRKADVNIITRGKEKKTKNFDVHLDIRSRSMTSMPTPDRKQRVRLKVI